MPRRTAREPYGFSSRRRSDYDEGYDDGYDDGFRAGKRRMAPRYERLKPKRSRSRRSTKPRKLSAWQKYIKNKRNHIKLRSGKLNLKKMAVQFRKTKAGKKKK